MEQVSIKIQKNFTVEEASKFREETYSILSKGKVAFELDFSGCTFIDSTGLGVLVSLLKRCKDTSSELILKNMSSDILKMFEITRLDTVFDIR